jgi:hypothetical protein
VGFNDWIYASPAPTAIDGRQEEVEERVRSKLAAQIQERLRTRLDPGIDLRSAKRAQAVRSVADGNRIVITGDDEDAKETSSIEANSVDDLFKLSSGVPEVYTDEFGTTQMVFRSIKMSSLLEVTQDDQDKTVDQIVTDVLQLGMVDAIEDAMKDVESTYPAESKR